MLRYLENNDANSNDSPQSLHTHWLTELYLNPGL